MTNFFSGFLTNAKPPKVSFETQLLLNHTFMNHLRLYYGSEANFKQAYDHMEQVLTVSHMATTHYKDCKKWSSNYDPGQLKMSMDDALDLQTKTIFFMTENLKEQGLMEKEYVTDAINPNKRRIGKFKQKKMNALTAKAPDNRTTLERGELTALEHMKKEVALAIEGLPRQNVSVNNGEITFDP